MNKINSSEIQEIEITNPVSSVTITNQEDSKKLYVKYDNSYRLFETRE